MDCGQGNEEGNAAILTVLTVLTLLTVLILLNVLTVLTVLILPTIDFIHKKNRDWSFPSSLPFPSLLRHIFYIVLYCTILYYTVLYCTMYYVLCTMYYVLSSPGSSSISKSLLVSRVSRAEPRMHADMLFSLLSRLLSLIRAESSRKVVFTWLNDSKKQKKRPG